MNSTVTSARIVPGILEIEAALPTATIQAAKNAWECIPCECIRQGIDTGQPTHVWLPKLKTSIPALNTALSWVEAGLHEGFHLYQLLSTNFGRTRVANEHEMLEVKAHAYDGMIRSGFKLARPCDGGVDLCKMMLASPNPQFETMGDMLETFEEMREHGENFTDERLEAAGFHITANHLEEEAASFFGVYSLQGGDAIRTIGTLQRELMPKYSVARDCFLKAGGSDLLVLFAMIHLSFRFGAYTEEDADHPVAIFATLIERMEEVNDTAAKAMARHSAMPATSTVRSLADILGTKDGDSRDIFGNGTAQAELSRHPLNDDQLAAIRGFGTLCEALASIIVENCRCLEPEEMESDDLFPRKPYFEGVWRGFNEMFPAWKHHWAIAINLIQPFGTPESGFMFWKSIRDVVSFGDDRLEIGGIRQAYLAFDRLERVFQGKSTRLAADMAQGALNRPLPDDEKVDSFREHALVPPDAAGSINALLAESGRHMNDLTFNPSADAETMYLNLPGGFYLPKSLLNS